jgi:DNA-binding transcriptional ArsR family regulator
MAPEAAPVAPLEIVDDLPRARLLVEPQRLALLAALAEPGSAPELARRLGLPRQRVGYHLRELERAGLVELVEERRKRNCLERVVRASARAYVLDPALFGAAVASPEEARDRFSWAALVSAAARAIRDLAVLRRRADRAGKRLATLTLETEVAFATPERQAAFATELATLVTRLAEQYDDGDRAGARPYRVIAAAYPAIRAPSDEEERSSP